MFKRKGIVLELQRDCLNPDISVSNILRKAKVIAAKLDLADLEGWIDNELNGYLNTKLADLPPHRKAWGSPKFFNPYRGYCPIIVQDDEFGKIVSTVFLSQNIGALEDLSNSDEGTLIYKYPPVVQQVLQNSMDVDMECSLHFSTTQVRAALEHIRNRVLEWTLELEKRGVVGENFSFDETDKREAQAVTNHIYGSNIGVLGEVGGNATVAHQNVGQTINFELVMTLASKIREAAPGLPADTADSLVGPIAELESAAKSKDESKVKAVLSSMVPILQGAAGNLAASGILAAISTF